MFTEILKFYFEYHIVIVDTIKNIVIQKVIFVPLRQTELMYRKIISQNKVQMLFKSFEKCIKIDSQKKEKSLARPFWYSLRTVS